jgi:A/G-specific adenine glycosylase
MGLIHFSQRVVAWQRVHGRNHLPWTQESAYRVWLSEVMLQQTQVATVLAYYATFIHHYPALKDLANAPIDEVLAKWAGLGYYSRARNLHRCAQLLMREYAGQFPRDLQSLQTLPGIGPSTAAAIASLAMGQRAAILDGNVKRVLARHGGIQGWPGMPSVSKQLWQLATERLVPSSEPVTSDHHRRYTQGLMDLGAAVCSSKKPQCHLCPIADDCAALLNQLTHSIPAKRPKKVISTQYRCALVLHDGDGVWLERRPDTGIWSGLLCLPESSDEAAAQARAFELGAKNKIVPWYTHSIKHTFTHYHLQWEVWSVQVESSFKLPPPWRYTKWEQVQQVGVPKAVLKVLGRL